METDILLHLLYSSEHSSHPDFENLQIQRRSFLAYNITNNPVLVGNIIINAAQRETLCCIFNNTFNMGVYTHIMFHVDQILKYKHNFISRPITSEYKRRAVSVIINLVRIIIITGREEQND